jgi:general secretion pathway protein A
LYESFFNFQEQPFRLTPDPRFIYLSPGHGEALQHMLYGVRERKGFILMVGNIGAGKTTLTRLLIDQVGEDVHLGLVFNTFLNEVELLRAINREFKLPAKSASRETLIQILNHYLIKLLKRGGNAVLILDEAQNLSVPVLEQVRMLSNLETDNQKLIQIILVGQPELSRTLLRPDMVQLNQRITVRCYLSALSEEDTVRYIHQRLSVAGPRAQVRFHPKTYHLIWKYSEGIPRSINALCDRALLVAYSKGAHEIIPPFIKQAQAEITGLASSKTLFDWFKERFRSPAFLPAVLIVLVLGLFAYWSLFRGEVFPP